MSIRPITSSQQKVRVVLFSGGRGSSALAKQLIVQENIQLTLLVNGYDDGLSTGEVRRFLGDSLGPSDFRKNATRMALTLQSCSQGLIDILDLRFPVEIDDKLVKAVLDSLANKKSRYKHEFMSKVADKYKLLDKAAISLLAERMLAFCNEVERTGKVFDYSDCSLGNLVFAGSFLLCERDFNRAVKDYSVLLGLPEELILNVTRGENSFLVATNRDGEFLASEADIVDANKRNHIQEFHLIDAPLSEQEIKDHSGDKLSELLQSKQSQLQLNPEAQVAITQADIIVYAPGTQHSSLFPSYITPKLGDSIASNANAWKLLITNIQEDAEIPDSDAVSIIEKAVFYLREKGAVDYPVSSLMTHYLVNDPSQKSNQGKYIPLGDLTDIEDPRLLRVQNFEDQLSGVHDADKILMPFVNQVEASRMPLSIAVLLLQNTSTEKTVQTVLEMARAMAYQLHEITVYYSGDYIDYLHNMNLPFKVSHLESKNTNIDKALLNGALDNEYDYICLMECSGMYHGYDVVSLLSNLNKQNVDAVWGSRRLSVSDVQASYKFRYRRHPVLGVVSYLGSHLLSLMYLCLYGHFISDTLSGVRVVHSRFLKEIDVDIQHSSFNQYLLCQLLQAKGQVFEIPVDFLPMSPDKVKRTSVVQGMHNFAVILLQRIKTLFG